MELEMEPMKEPEVEVRRAAGFDVYRSPPPVTTSGPASTIKKNKNKVVASILILIISSAAFSLFDIDLGPLLKLLMDSAGDEDSKEDTEKVASSLSSDLDVSLLNPDYLYDDESEEPMYTVDSDYSDEKEQPNSEYSEEKERPNKETLPESAKHDLHEDEETENKTEDDDESSGIEMVEDHLKMNFNRGFNLSHNIDNSTYFNFSILTSNSETV